MRTVHCCSPREPTISDDGIDATEDVTGGRPAAPGDAGVPLGAQLGRFVVLERLGAGGSGVVVAAYDPVLDRRVALKVLRPERVGGAGAEALVREAQALARVYHRNVVAVYDAGAAGDRVYVVMELVTGGTLRAWLAARRRSIGEICAAFAEVAAGLAALHEAGLVHRDVKPDNVLVGEDGRMCVSDPGLAGVVAGTPRYMAPEQREGGPVDARADQYAFCVALAEALESGGEDGGGDARRAPAWLRALVQRGLSSSPGDRHARMRELAAELTRDHRPRWRRVAPLAAITALAVVAAIAVIALTGRQIAAPPVPPAVPAVDPLAGVWDDARRASVRAALSASRRTHAAESADRTVRAIDTRAAALGAALARGGAGAAGLAACVDDLRALIDALGAGTERAAIDLAGAAIDALPDPETCALRAAPDERGRGLWRELAAISALAAIGGCERALPRIREVVEAARVLGPSVAAVRAHLVAASVEGRCGEPLDARSSLERARRAAPDPALAADAVLALARHLASTRRDPRTGLAAVAPVRDALLARSGPTERAAIRHSLAALHHAAGEPAAARALLVEAASALGPDVPAGLRARLAQHLAVIEHALGDLAAAAATARRAADLFAGARGPLHPDVGHALLAACAVSRGADTESCRRSAALFADDFAPMDRADPASALEDVAMAAHPRDEPFSVWLLPDLPASLARGLSSRTAP